MLTREKSRAVIYGLACGDALGWPVEFSKVAEIRRRYGSLGIRDLCQTKGEFTDDSQMTIALAEGLLDAHAESPDLTDIDRVMPFVARRFLQWSESPENNRAPGSTCMAGCRALGRGAPWTKSGVPDSKGCGSVMRVAPIGLLLRNEDTIATLGAASSVVTHGHPAALLSAHLGALAIKLLLDGVSPKGVLKRLTRIAHEHPPGAESVHELLTRVPLAVAATLDGTHSPEEIQTHGASPRLGESWKGDEALASALYCLLLADARDVGYVEAVRYGANTDGDSDSIACIVGGMAGALWGIGGGRGIPQSWVDQIEATDRLGLLADRIAAAAEL